MKRLNFFPLTAIRTKARNSESKEEVPVTEALPLPMLITDEYGRCVYSNAAYGSLCGWSAADLMGSHWSSVVDPQDHDAALSQWQSAVSGQGSFMQETRLLRADGGVIWTRRDGAALNDGVPGHHYVHTIEDISTYKASDTARLAAERRLGEQEQTARTTLDFVGDAVVGVDLAGRVTFMNRAAGVLAGFNPGDALGRPSQEILRLFDGTTRRAKEDPASRAMESGRAVGLENNTLLVTPDGLELAIEDSAVPLKDRSNNVVGAAIVFHDTRYSSETIARMAHLAQHDPLTGLLNRHAFADRFQQSLALAARHGKQMGVLFVDLDNFKELNDALGHSNGDRILAALANKLLSCVRTTDAVIRYGGDEFVMLLSELAQPADAHAVADKVRQKAAESICMDAKQVSLQLSIGVSIYPDDGDSLATLVQRADSAMYQAKVSKKAQERVDQPMELKF